MKIQLEENKGTFLIDSRCYEQNVIFKVAYMYTDNYYLTFEYKDQHLIEATIEPKNLKDVTGLDQIIKTFENDLLIQKVRYDISKETKNIRELILGRALYSTCLEVENVEEENVTEEETPLDQIAVNWFEGEEEN